MNESLTLAGAAAGAALGLSATAKNLLEKALGPAAEAMGSVLQQRVHEYFAKNRARVLERAADMAGASAREVHDVPLRTLVPLLEGASLEDDHTLQELWAALLANAATTESFPVTPLFVGILSQLSPLGARMLDAIARTKPIVSGAGLSRRGLPAVRNLLSPVDVAVTMAVEPDGRFESALDELAGQGILERWALERNEVVFEFTSLGQSFLAACQAPSRVEK